MSQKVVDREMANIDAETSDESSTKPSSSIPTTRSTMVGRVNMRKEDGQSAKANDIDSTPTMFVSTPDRLMPSTPAMAPPKQSSMTPDDDFSYSTNKLVRRPPCSRSIVFDTPTKGEIDVSLDDDILDVHLVQSVINLLVCVRKRKYFFLFYFIEKPFSFYV